MRGPHRDLRDADHRKDHFLATSAHELRNPLSPPTGRAIFQMEPETPQVVELTVVMSRQLDQLRRLIDDLLDVSRISSGKLMLRRQPGAVGRRRGRRGRRRSEAFNAGCRTFLRSPRDARTLGRVW